MVPQPAQATWQRKTLQLADGDLEYVDTGGTGEAVVLLHGVLMDELLWAPVVERLVPRWRCLVPTLPLGAHRIPRPADADQGPHGVARMVAGFIRALDLEPVIVVGNDTGGALAQLLVASQPELIDRLVLVSCDAYDNFPPGLPGRTLAAASAIPGGLRLSVAALKLPSLRRLPMTFSWMSKLPIDPAIFDRWLAAFFADSRIADDLRGFMRAIDRRDLLEAASTFHAFDGRVLIVWAADDRVMPLAHASELAGAFPRARTVVLDDCRTLIPLDSPEALASTIDRFLSGEEVGTASPPRSGHGLRRGRWYASTGWWAIGIALAHLAAAPLFYGESLRQLLSRPLVGALDANPGDPAARGAAFWYLVAGGLLLGLGCGARRAEAKGRVPTREFAASLLALGSVGVVVSPASPFWLVLATGLVAAHRRRKARPAMDERGGH